MRGAVDAQRPAQRVEPARNALANGRLRATGVGRDLSVIAVFGEPSAQGMALLRREMTKQPGVEVGRERL